MRTFTRRLSVPSCLSLFMLVAFAAKVHADAAWVYIINKSKYDVTLRVEATNSDYEGSVGIIKDKNNPIKANSEWRRDSGRNSANSGSVGGANYYFDPAPIGTYAKVQIHGGNGYWFEKDHPQMYPGTFYARDDPNNPKPGENVYKLASPPPKVEDEGEWVIFCPAGACVDKRLEVEKTLEERKRAARSTSDETSVREKVCAKAGGRGVTYSAEVEGCVDKEGRHREDINVEQELLDEIKTLEASTFELNPNRMREAEVGAAWHWVWKENPGNGWTTQPSKGPKVTAQFACPKGTAKPKYLPESAENDADNCARLIGDDP